MAPDEACLRGVEGDVFVETPYQAPPPAVYHPCSLHC